MLYLRSPRTQDVTVLRSKNHPIQLLRYQFSFCKKPGHSDETCFAKARSESRNKHSVNLCSDPSANSAVYNNDITTAVLYGIPVDVLIDSGALNISLISADVLKYLPCQPKPKRYVLKGISPKEIVSESYVTVTLEFSDISIEVDLVVVPSSCMNAPIIIGTDVLNRDGVMYIRTKNRQYLSHSKHVPSRRINAVQADDLPTIQTPLQGKDREALMSIIDEFSEFLITGTAATSVKTGEMEIKLTS